MITIRSLVSARRIASRRASTANLPLWNSQPSTMPPLFGLPNPRLDPTSYMPGWKNSRQLSNPAAPAPVFLAPITMS